jgi:uncharacterized membrane protein
MQCPSCHQETSGAFCSFCGATLAAPAGAGAPAVLVPTAGSGLSNNAAAIAYLTIIPLIIFLLIDPYRRIPLVRFHSIQNIALAIVWVALVVLSWAMMILHVVLPFIFLLVSLAELLAAACLFVAWFVAIIKASKGEFFMLPIIGDFAANLANV